jgi:hypothetical protein
MRASYTKGSKTIMRCSLDLSSVFQQKFGDFRKALLCRQVEERANAIATSNENIRSKPTSEKASYLADLILLDSANNRAVSVVRRPRS